ncbi:hypothetical protein L207DRAFT_466103 [Hyaloscypha variabilis F]|uniref:Uncharacterized protein n=1 Tax=Hyaloscypha variabilis (strain UAMH 11265 / GT02V1 / F) TaxID=1149755 RepID=A0A2J6RCZ8_HYAVF|nr:hypothetical protein L207DRAFT_466103 [Hyaloscypha variabilis F]
MEHKKRRNLHNARKTYVLAQAAPLSSTQRIFNITPKVLFQLQELSSLDRPQPVIDVVAAKVHAPKLSHGECLRMFKRRRAWRDSRIIVLKIDDYNTTQDHCSADTIEEALAVIVGWHRDNQEAEICFAGGSTWKATCFPNEVFEFVLETGTSNGFSAAKWQPVGRMDHGFNITPKSAPDGSPAEQQYKLSVVNYGRRRNPILASLTRTRLEISEHYSSTDHNHDPSGTDLTSTVEASDESGNSCTSKEVDGNLKTLIQVTAIWIALSLGWCVGFNLH